MTPVVVALAGGFTADDAVSFRPPCAATFSPPPPPPPTSAQGRRRRRRRRILANTNASIANGQREKSDRGRAPRRELRLVGRDAGMIIHVRPRAVTADEPRRGRARVRELHRVVPREEDGVREARRGEQERPQDVFPLLRPRDVVEHPRED
jgi:hypothetical protein